MTLEATHPLAHWALVERGALELARGLLETVGAVRSTLARPTKLADLAPTSIDAGELAQLVSARLVAIHRDSITSEVRADGTGRQPAGGGANSAYEAPEGTPGAAWQGWGTRAQTGARLHRARS